MNTHATPPIATATRKNSARVCVSIASALPLVRRLGGIERGRQPLLLAVVARPLPEARAADAGGAVAADQIAVGVLAHQGVDENILGDDDVALHADHLGDVGDAA